MACSRAKVIVVHRAQPWNLSRARVRMLDDALILNKCCTRPGGKWRVVGIRRGAMYRRGIEQFVPMQSSNASDAGDGSGLGQFLYFYSICSSVKKTWGGRNFGVIRSSLWKPR